MYVLKMNFWPQNEEKYIDYATIFKIAHAAVLTQRGLLKMDM
jgi:hypothetical protein